MAWRPHGRAKVDASAPRAFGKCDRCQFLTNLKDLQFQREWAGNNLINKRLKVCRICLDKPQPQLRDKRVQADPMPVKNPRPLNDYPLEYPTRGAFDSNTFDNSTFDVGFVPIDPDDIVNPPLEPPAGS